MKQLWNIAICEEIKYQIHHHSFESRLTQQIQKIFHIKGHFGRYFKYWKKEIRACALILPPQNCGKTDGGVGFMVAYRMQKGNNLHWVQARPAKMAFHDEMISSKLPAVSFPAPLQLLPRGRQLDRNFIQCSLKYRYNWIETIYFQKSAYCNYTRTCNSCAASISLNTNKDGSILRLITTVKFFVN